MRLADTYDVIVCGGGFSGVAAALTLRRAGFSCHIVEPRSALGWEATRAGMLDWTGDKSETGALFAELMTARGGLRHGRLDAPIAEVTLDELVENSGADLLLHARAVGAGTRDGSVLTVHIAAKATEFDVAARAIVDATRSGLVWTRTEGQITPPDTSDAVFTVFFSRCEPLPECVVRLGELGGVSGVVLRSGVWPGDLAAEFHAPAGSLIAARLALPDFLRALRASVAELADAIVTHTALETFPADFGRATFEGFRHPEMANLFGAGPWIADDSFSPSPAALCRLGEQVAGAVAAALPSLPAPERGSASTSMDRPPAHETDVLVVGGGTAGALAAIAAAQEGARVTLIEQGSCLGGIGCAGGIHSYYRGVPGGLQDEVDRRVEEIAPLFSGDGPCHGFHPEAKKVALEQMAAEAGVDIVYETCLTRVDAEPSPTRLPASRGARPVTRVRAAAGVGPQGAEAWNTSVIIDATGDGDAAALAGASFNFGRQGDGLPHAYSLSAGVIAPDRGMYGLNFDAGFCDPNDVADMTRARRRALEFYRQETYTEDDRVLYIAPLLGLRQSRQIVGDYQLTLADEIEGREFPDVIAYAMSHYDNHADDYENESDAAVFWVWALGQWRRPFGCEIPFRCLLPQGVEGLLVACRALSVTQDAHHQLRMQNDMQRIGEAAGAAAALAVRDGKTPREIEVAELQARLIASGALGKPERKELPAPGQVAAGLHEESWRPAAPPAAPAAELVERLEGEEAPDAAWSLLRYGSDAVPELLRALDSDKPDKRYTAAAVLAAMKRHEAAPELLRLLRERDMTQPESPRAAPRWVVAIPLLRMAGATEAAADIAGVIADPDAPLNALVAALRALGSLGDASVVQAILDMLDRPDLPSHRTFSRARPGHGSPEYVRWQLDLAAADALARLGCPRPDIARRHLDDPRVLVRRHAQRILDSIEA